MSKSDSLPIIVHLPHQEINTRRSEWIFSNIYDSIHKLMLIVQKCTANKNLTISHATRVGRWWQLQLEKELTHSLQFLSIAQHANQMGILCDFHSVRLRWLLWISLPWLYPIEMRWKTFKETSRDENSLSKRRCYRIAFFVLLQILSLFRNNFAIAC